MPEESRTDEVQSRNVFESQPDHPAWVPDTEGHVWGKWYPQGRRQQYRSCVHPFCNAVEKREAPTS